MLTVISAFNEARMLPMCLGHLPRDARVWLFDGAYEDFPHDKPYSTDGTLDVARRWGAKVIAAKRPWRDQMEKRTKTLVPGEVIFILDADELLHTEMPVLPDDADVGWITISSPVYSEPCLEPRVFRVGKGWHYAGRHHWIYDGANRLVASHHYPAVAKSSSYRHAILPVLIENARNMRGPVRYGDKQRYSNSQYQRESAFVDESSVYQDIA